MRFGQFFAQQQLRLFQQARIGQDAGAFGGFLRGERIAFGLKAGFLDPALGDHFGRALEIAGIEQIRKCSFPLSLRKKVLGDPILLLRDCGLADRGTQTPPEKIAKQRMETILLGSIPVAGDGEEDVLLRQQRQGG